MHQHNRYYLLLLLLAMPYCAQAMHTCPEWLAKAVTVQGTVDVQHFEDSIWTAIDNEHIFCYGDKIRTATNSRATLVFNNGTLATLNQNTTLNFNAPEDKKSSWVFNLFKGIAFFRSRQPQRLQVNTPFVNGVHEGTEFLVSVDDHQTEISVFDGVVAASNEFGEIKINKGFIGIANGSQAPRVQALTVQLADAVEWTLYYPPLLDFQNLSSQRIAALQPTIDAYQQGDSDQALALLEAIPDNQQDANLLAYQAAILLTVGRVDAANALITRAKSLESTNSTALALQSIIAVTKNQQDQALSLAQQAVSQNPQSAVAQIALSYAHQAQFDIDQALEATEAAVRLSPENALAWARLSELQLATGERSDALESAHKAQQLNPKLGRTQTILGFAYLAQVDINEAKATFTKAIKLNAADPLAHLGLGLAKIRKGNIEAGTRDLETSVSLDPDNAIMRSYLGKAYYELRNDDFAATELSLAKTMDPNDPTPWFYDAIRKQTTNRPVEALHDMQKAIELNDNRAVYRSKLLLDEDAAAKSANIARIYQDLGFERVALKQARDSLNQDFTNPSAHRFLSDSLQGQPRLRIARASELLQAQLLQPINVVPVQPQLTGENIGILNNTGPGSLSTGEYDALFTSNGAHLLLNGAYGSNNTLTDSAIISGVYDRLSLSLGQFHYQTDGFRKNDDYQQDIYNAFIQYAVTPDFNFQFEFKTEDIRNGDVPFRLNGFHRENFRQVIEQDTARFGAHYRIDPKQDVIVSAFYTTRKDSSRNIRFFPFPDFIGSEITTNEDLTKGYQAEMQYLFHPSSFDITWGLGYLEFETESRGDTTFTTSPLLNGFPKKEPTDFNQSKTQYFNTYLYSKLRLLPDITGILGLSFDSYKDNSVDRQQISPKVGIIWNPVDKLTLRGATFRTLKRPLAANQTIEPTQIAGFNQFYDGNNGTSAWNYSLGADFQPIHSLFVGGEVNWRYSDEPFISERSNNRDRDEVSHLAYLYWTPADWLAVQVEYQYDKTSREFIVGRGNQTNPQRVATHQVPFSILFFQDSGIFANLSATYVRQEVAVVTDSVTSPLEHDNERFWTFDTALGYRFPKKLGLISFEVRNVFNNGHAYQSVFDASGPQLSPFTPEREFFVRLNLFY